MVKKKGWKKTLTLKTELVGVEQKKKKTEIPDITSNNKTNFLPKDVKKKNSGSITKTRKSTLNEMKLYFI